MNGIGLNHGEYNSSAALYQAGAIVAGSPEERFCREKLTKQFPSQAMDFCLRAGGIEFSDLEFVAQAWDPGAGWLKYNPPLSRNRIKREDYFYTVPDNLKNLAGRGVGDWVKMEFDAGYDMPAVYYVHHHRTHAANAFFLSEFEEAAFLTIDWKGEFECATWGRGIGNRLEVLKKQNMPHSVGMFYATFTELLGYRPDSDEWKVMALSAFDTDWEPVAKKIRDTLRLLPEGGVELDQSYYKGADLEQPHLYTSRLVELLGGRVGDRTEEPGEWHYRVARAMQRVSEEIALHMLNHLHEITGSSRVVLSGGFFMNSVFNGRLHDLCPFKESYISYAPSDVGNSLGAVLYVAHCILGEPRVPRQNRSAIGPSFEPEHIEQSLRRRAIAFRQVNDPAEKVAELLASGEIVAVFNGPMEFGERALGHRSILADPRKSTVKDDINSLIKYREGYRPFAPAIPVNRTRDFFEVPEDFSSHYMERVVPVRPEWRDKLPGITHIDGSGRVQTVEPETQEYLHAILEAFDRRTQVPVVVNTSFNINGEPIVCSPDDALSTFYNSGLRHLMLENYYVCKS